MLRSLAQRLEDNEKLEVELIASTADDSKKTRLQDKDTSKKKSNRQERCSVKLGFPRPKKISKGIGNGLARDA
jgi:hypothetical protein